MKKVWVFWPEHSRKWEIYFVFCELNIGVIWFAVLEINICSLDLQDIIIYKMIKKTITAVNKGYFKWDYNPFQKQPPEVFYKKAVLKFCNILRKKTVLESLFNKITGLQASNFIKKRLTGVFLWMLRNFWQHLFRRTSERCSVIINFYVFMRKPVLQICAEQLISGVEFQIGQNNRYEIYPDMNFISFLNM